MIRIRPLAPEYMDTAYLAPFLQQYGRLPVTQVPPIAAVLADGDRLLAFEFLEREQPVGYVLVKVRHRILADISFGPVVLQREQFISCVQALKGALRRRGFLLLRVLPPEDAPVIPGMSGHFNWATSIIDISRPEAEILQSFSPNHRQSIRKASAAGIAIRDLQDADIDAYTAGHVAMFARRGIVRDPGKTRQLVSRFERLSAGPGGEVFMLVATLPPSGSVIGGGIFLRNGDTCMYYHGFAGRPDQPLPVLHLLLWEAMKRAKAAGCSRFDLAGISLDNEDRQLKAVNDFKRWFRGEIVHYPPTAVIPLYPLIRPLLKLIGNRI